MKKNETYFVYVLVSLKDGQHYTGLSHNVQSRLNDHNSGKVRSTKGRVPFILLYSEKIGSLSEARQREKYLKSSVGRRYLKKVLAMKKVSGSPPA